MTVTRPVSTPDTVFDALVRALREADRFNVNDQSAPAAILWCDVDREWSAIIPRLQQALPLLTFGTYDSANRTGPAIWLRSAIERLLTGLDLPAGTPIVYLPGIDSNTFRSAANVPKELEPLVELRYRGVVFRHPNGRDWTPRGFLQGRLGANVREDQETARALQGALEHLLDEPVAAISQKALLDAAFFRALVTPDPIRELLAWMNSEGAQLEALKGSSERWRAFCDVVKATYGIDPERDGPLTAAERLITAGTKAQDPWNAVWARFCEAPIRYPSMPDLLRRAAGDQVGMFGASDRAPNDNEREEQQLRTALLSLDSLSPTDARTKLVQLEKEHGHRRTWVWAELGLAPLAKALGPLTVLLNHTATPIGSGTPAEIAERYTEAGWRADRATLHVLAEATESADARALDAAVRAIYRPWLEAGAETLQAAVRAHGLPPLAPTPTATPGTCLLFTDGLRYDVANDLAVALRDRGHSADVASTFGSVPGVTASAKPAVSPARDDVEPGSEFNVTFGGTAVNASVLRRAIAEHGFQVLEGDDVGDPSGSGWTECGNFDAIGHADGAKLAHRITTEVRSLAERVQTLLEAGWREVVVVTDHGWLLLPGGLPTVSLPQHLTVARKGRCARLKDGAATEYQTLPWTFDDRVAIAVAPGIAVFVNGNEYEHGGLSVQESVLPVLSVRAGDADGTTTASWISATWAGLRLRVQVNGAPAGARLDLRTKAADPSASIAADPKPLDEAGHASLVVPDDDRLGTAAFLVLMDADDRVLLQRTTVVGEG